MGIQQELFYFIHNILTGKKTIMHYMVHVLLLMGLNGLLIYGYGMVLGMDTLLYLLIMGLFKGITTKMGTTTNEIILMNLNEYMEGLRILILILYIKMLSYTLKIHFGLIWAFIVNH